MALSPKTHLFIVGIFAAIVGVLLLHDRFAPISATSPATQGDLTAKRDEVPLITYERHENDLPGASAHMIMNVPKLALASDASATEHANAYIDRFMKDLTTQFVDAIPTPSTQVSTATLQATTDGATGTLPATSGVNALAVDAQTLFSAPGLVAIRVVERATFIALPRPLVSYRYLTFDLENDRMLAVNDFFASQQAMGAAKKAFASGGVALDSVEKSLSENDHIGVGPDGLYLSIDDASSSSPIRPGLEYRINATDTALLIPDRIAKAFSAAETNIRMSRPEN